MGSQVSVLFYTFKSIINDYNAFSKRISDSPGIPKLNSSVPFWTVPNSAIARHGADKELPQSTDVIIIGSGISGTAIAKTLLEDHQRRYPNQSLNIVMLEARDACSGATGRNGGHACPNVYNEYAQLKTDHGVAVAVEILRFRLAHIETLIGVAKEENLLPASQARVVDDYDAFIEPDMLKRAKADLNVFLKEVPKDLAENFQVIEGRKATAALQLSSSIQGCIVKPGASIHPYRFVTGVLSNLISRHSNFQLFTRTPCTNIRTSDGAYIVSTPRGDIKAQHVIHAANAWSSHLLPGMRRKIIPVRAHMSAQRPGQGLMPSRNPCGPNSNPTDPNPIPNWAGSRAFVFYPSLEPLAYDYLTQLLPSNPNHSNPLPTSGELMYGGGALLGGASENALIDNIGIADDSGTQFQVEAYLSGSLERYFADHWGMEGNEPDTEAGSPDIETGKTWGKGRVKAVWTGIIGLSADLQPWVGRVPKIASERREPVAPECDIAFTTESKSIPKRKLAAPGEWISAGFTGEGMVHAWLSGKAVAGMVLGEGPRNLPSSESNSLKEEMIDLDDEAGLDEVALPAPFLITEKRVKRANIEKFMSDMI